LGGLSRSAVLGKIFRLRLGTTAAAAASKPQKKAAANDQHRKARPPKTRQKANAARHASSTPKNAPAWRRPSARRGNAPHRPRAKTATRGKTLLELTNNNCRWPHGRPGTAGFFFCGAASADLERGMPYCPRHARRAYLTDPAVVATAKPLASRAAY
jgi:GcrA cell cycle regulator